MLMKLKEQWKKWYAHIRHKGNNKSTKLVMKKQTTWKKRTEIDKKKLKISIGDVTGFLF
jgi:hypothetical protein